MRILSLLHRFAVAVPLLALLFLAPQADAQIYDLPSSVTINEDSSGSFNFKVDAWGVYRNVGVITANPGLVPNSNITVTFVREFYEFPTWRREYRVSFSSAANAAGSTTFIVNANDGAGVQNNKTVSINITQVNDAPVISNLPVSASIQKASSVPSSYSVDFQVADIENIAGTSVTVSSSNTGLVPNSGANLSVTRVTGGSSPNTFRLGVTPVLNAVGTTTLTITATEGGQSTSRTLLLEVTEEPPLILGLIPLVIVLEDTVNQYQFSVSDRENIAGTVVTATSSNPTLFPNSPANIQVTRLTSGAPVQNFRLTLQPAANQSGSAIITVTASEGGKSFSSILTVIVSPVNDAPTLSVPTFAMFEDSTASLAVTVSDVDSSLSSVTVTATSSDPSLISNSGIVVSGTGGSRTMTFTPQPEQFGSATITATASDGSGGVTTKAFLFIVREVNDTPVAGSPTALAFDGFNDQAVANGTGLAPGNTPHTVEAWVFPKVVPAFRQWILHLGSAGTGHHWLLRTDGTIQFGAWGRDAQVADVPLPVGVWTHIAAVWDGTVLSVYFDGVKVGQTTSTVGFDMSAPNLNLGSRFSGSDTSFYGYMDEVRVWNRALLPGEIQSRRRVPLRGSEAGLLVYLPFEEGKGVTAFDRAALGTLTHATLYGGARFAPRGEGGDTDPDSQFLYSVVEETATPIYLQGFDMETTLGQSGGTLSYVIVTPPAHGTLRSGVTTVGAGFSDNWADASRNPLIYTPSAAYNGPDQFTFRLRDGGNSQSALVTVPIVVEDVNDNPTITPIANRVIEEGTSTEAIPFIIGDEETPVANLVVNALSSDTRLVPPSGIVFGGTGANRTLTLTPAAGEVGTLTISVTVTDSAVPSGFVTIQFRLRVDPKPAYALVDLGALGTLNKSSGFDISDAGWAVGLARSGADDAHALLYRGLTGTRIPEDFLGAVQGTAYGINASNGITGFRRATAGGIREAFVWRENAVTSLATRISGADSVGYDINLAGDVVGSFASGSLRRGFYLPASSSSPMVNLGTLAGFTAASEALGINAFGRTVGYSQDATGKARGFYWDGGSLVAIGPLPGHDHARAHSINDDGLITGFSAPNASPNSPRRAFVYENGALRDLGVLSNGTYSAGWAINAFGQVVGEADRATVRRAFLSTSGQMRDLNELIHDGEILPDLTSGSFSLARQGWELIDARSINSRGVIVGTARRDGNDRAYMAVPAWVIGRQIPIPEGAVARLPEIELIRGDDGDTAQNAFFWSEFEKRLYAIRPVAARLRWFTSLDLTSGSGSDIQVNSDRIDVEGISVWPKDPVIHVTTAPVEIEPRGVPFDYSFQSILFDTTAGAVAVDPTSKTFNSIRPGFSVAYYLKTDGGSPNPVQQRPYFEVVRSVTWNDPSFLRERTAVVGQTLTDPPSQGDSGHTDYLNKQGWVYHPLCFYDGVGEDRAHDRALRRGPIIPVNLDSEGSDDDLVVVWYRLSRIGVAWASVPVRYSVSWPSDDEVAKIIIASGTGSGAFPADWVSPRAYHQPDPALPGYNPNEEHALVLPSNGGGGLALFALRFDLNAAVVTPASEPYALLKFRDRTTGQWRIQPYKVVGEEDPHFFTFSGTAGNEIAPPYPLSILPLCTDSQGVSGPFWEDWQGRLYARAAGAFGEATNVVVQWSYPLQPGFFFDLNLDGLPDAPIGGCVAWMDRREDGDLGGANATAGDEGTSMDVTYRIVWPDAPVLQIGETLIEPKNGLPDIRNMASVEFVYDDLSPAWNPLEPGSTTPVQTLARLYDPFSTRTYALGESEVIPTAIKRSARGGKEYFDDLPPSLQTRLTYDPSNRWLQFTGVLNNDSAGEPLVLPNVLFSRERDIIKELAPDDTQWAAVVDALYDRTRNPNQIDHTPGDGEPDSFADGYDAITNAAPGLRLGLTTNELGTIIPETLGSLPKALTSAIGDVPSAEPRPLKAFSFDGAGGHLNAGAINLDGSSFTLEFWARAESIDTANYIAGLGTTDPDGQLIVGFDDIGRFVFRFSAADTTYVLTTPDTVADLEWHHWAVTFNAATLEQAIFRDGTLLANDTSAGVLRAAGELLIGRRAGAGGSEAFHGELDEVRLWNHARSAFVLARDSVKALTGHEDGLIRYYRANDYTDSSPSHVDATAVGGAVLVDSTAPTGIPPRYVVLAENNSASLAGFVIKLHIIRVEDGPFQGDLKVLYPGNVFDQRLTMRHSSDFGGDPDPLEFEWYYKPDNAGTDPTDLPRVNAAGAITDTRGWIAFTAFEPASGHGVNDVTIGTPAQSGLLSLGDNWFVCRYRGFDIHGSTPWSGWIGDPSGGAIPRAQFAEGWIKRVIRGLNPFDARTADFHANASATYASMVLQAGERFEGDIAFNPDGDNLNSLGLIEAYTTVLRRGKSLSIEGTPAVDFNPANNALLLAASRIADLYMLLGNEAYADAQDPTIGFTSASEPYQALSTSIFTFQNQLDSLLAEELALLRGRDDANAGVGARPVYNRLFWNFTLGEGEVAYQQSYNIGDQNFDGFINETDARRLYPQGHGDAWGHYLTAIKSYYDLLRHPKFTWVPRSENVLVAGVAVEVDFLDERKFAQAASARAKAGREIVDLTYRENYVDDPDGQWQGYRDPDTDRAWGVADWASRVGQGAYFDWLTANTVLPSVNTDPEAKGIRRIDRTTVTDIDEIIAQYDEIQATMDKADVGLNPLGLAKGAMVFDLDPTFLAVGSTAAIGRQAVQGLAHFEQLNERAIKALKNAQRIWDEANAQRRNLRENQDSVDAFTTNARDEETNFRNQLIEIFGYPHGGDIGPGKTYPSGYDGPDLYHYMYVPVAEITGETVPPSTDFATFFADVDVGLLGRSHFPTEEAEFFTEYDQEATDPGYLEIQYPQSEGGPWAFSAPAEWGRRRAPGRLQEALSEVLQATARLKFAGQNYDGLMIDINDKMALLKARFDVDAEKLTLVNTTRNQIVGANAALGVAKAVELTVKRLSAEVNSLSEITTESLPKVIGVAVDATAPARGIIKLGAKIGASALDVTGDVLDLTQTGLELSKEEVAMNSEIELMVLDNRYEVLQQVKELETQVLNEINLRLEVFQQEEALRQAYGRYLSTLAEGQRVLDSLVVFRKKAAAQTTEYRYRDMAFRIFRNEALQKYRATFDLAARYVYLCATAYDFESNFLGEDRRAASRFFDQIIRQRQLGVLIDGEPIPGHSGLADIQGRMIQNWEIIEPQFGLNNPQLESGRFSLRHELFRLRDDDPSRLDDSSDETWRRLLESRVVEDIWSIPEFRRYCRPFAPESAGPQPALVLRFPTTVQFGLNYFGRPLSGGDNAFDPTFFSTKINAVGVAFPGYDDTGLSRTPRVYLVPVGLDVLRAPTGSEMATRQWRVLDQAVPVPFAIGSSDFTQNRWVASQDSLSESYGQPRRFAALRAFSDSGDLDEQEMTSSTRLVARSVWNTEWMLIIPGGTLLNDPDQGIDRFIQSIRDIRLLMMVYSYAGQ
jgi:probable HAF family extracellular repeat protein